MSNSISVAILADMPRNAIGGMSQGRGAGQTATWLPQLAEAFSKEDGLTISWLTLDAGVRKLEIDEALGQRFYRIPKGKVTFDLLSNHYFARRKLLSVLNLVKPDVIHAWGSETSYPSAFDRVNIPKILSMQGILSHYHKIGGLPGGWRAKTLALGELPSVKRATVVTAESQWGIDRVREMHPSAIVRQVEYGVHPSFYDLKWDPNPDEPVLLFCGTLDWRKGFDVLMAAMQMCPTGKWKCRVAGDGYLRKQEEARNIPGVEFLGNLRWDDLQHHLVKSWALVLPTRADTSPNVVKEARVVGLPVITTPHGGQAGYIHHGQNGMIVEPLTKQNLREVMDVLMSDYANVRAMGSNRHKEDRLYFRSERTAAGFVEIYRQLATGTRIV